MKELSEKILRKITKKFFETLSNILERAFFHECSSYERNKNRSKNMKEEKLQFLIPKNLHELKHRLAHFVSLVSLYTS